MSVILDYRDNVIKQIKTALPQFKVVEGHPGKFELADLERLCIKTPAAYVSVLHVTPKGETIATGQVLAPVAVAVFIATRSGASRQKDADVQGWALAEAVYQLVLWNYFSTPQVFAKVTDLEIQNLWSREHDKHATCIMGVAWDTEIALGAERNAQFAAIKTGDGFQFSAQVNALLSDQAAETEEIDVAP